MKRLFFSCLTIMLMMLLMVSNGCISTAEFPNITEEKTITHSNPPTQTPTFTSEPTQTAPITWTPFPPEQAIPTIASLLDNNAGCQLPCWWGIIPGLTTWEETRSLIYPISSDIYEDEGGAAIFFSNLPNYVSLLGHIDISLRFSDGVVEYIFIYGVDGVYTYRLPEFLNTYGEPEEVWIFAYTPWPVDSDPNRFSMYLFYPSQGILAYYNDRNSCETRDDIAFCCIDETTGPGLWLWSPDKKMNFQEAVYVFEREMDLPYLPISEALGMDTSTFYQTYKNPNQSSCFETPRQLWRYWATATPKP